MIDDQIRQGIQAIKKLKEELRDIKKDMKLEEKIDSPEYTDLERAFKDLRQQVKDFKDQWMNELKTDESYNKLREIRLAKEEEVAEATNDLFVLISKLPQKAVDMNMDGDNGPIRVQIMPEMRLYLNGREEKKSS